MTMATVDTGSGLPGRLRENGYDLPSSLTFERWQEVGRTLQQMQRSVNWWAGDWLRFGEDRWGEAAYQAVQEITGNGDEALKQAVWVASKYPPSTRVPELSWSHHRAAAELEPDERQGLLEYAAREHLTTRDLIALVKERQQAIKGVVVAAETTCAADQVWSPTVADLTDDARAALTFKAETTAGVRDREAFAAGWLAALHWTEQTDCFSRWGDDDGTEVFGPAADHKAGEGAS